MNVTVKYRLSEAGRKAALLAGRPATQEVTETMEAAPSEELLAWCTITASGAAELNARGYGCEWLSLNVPPASVEDLARTFEAWKAAIQAKAQEREEEARRVREERAAAELAAIEAARPMVAASLESGEFTASFGTLYIGGKSYPMCDEDRAKAEAILKQRAELANAIAKEKAEKRAAARAAMIATRGGLVFPVEAGFCEFKGQNLWSAYQEKRWVGVFTGARGIDRFLDGPRGEFTWDVTPLQVGDCIQGGGFSQNKRGKRSNESEFFAVVVEKTDSEIVVAEQPTRAAALKVKL